MTNTMLPQKVINFGALNVASVATTPLDLGTLTPSGEFTSSTYLRLTVDQGSLFPTGIPYLATTVSGVINAVTASGTTDVSFNHVRSRFVDMSGCQWGGPNNGGEAPIDVAFTVDGSNVPQYVKMHTGNLATALNGRLRTSFGEQILCMAVTAMRTFTPANLYSYVSNVQTAAASIENNVSQAICSFLQTQGAQDMILQNVLHNNVQRITASGAVSLANVDPITLAFRLIGIDVTLTRNVGGSPISRKIVLSGIPLYVTLENFKDTRQLSMMDFPNTAERGITWADAATRTVGPSSDRVVLAGKSRGAILLYDPPRRMTYDVPKGNTVFAHMDASFNVHGLFRVVNNGYNTADNANDSSNFPDVETFNDGSMVVSFAYVNLASSPVRCKLLNVLKGTVLTEYPTTTASGAVAFTVLDSTGQKITDRVVHNIDGTAVYMPHVGAPAGLAAGIVSNKAKTAFFACLSVNRGATISDQTNAGIQKGVAIAGFPAAVTENHARLIIKFDMRLRVLWSAIMQPMIVNPTPADDGGVYIGTRFMPAGKGEIYDNNGNLVATLPGEIDGLGNTYNRNHVVRIGPSDSAIDIKWYAHFGLTGSSALSNLVDVESTSDGGVLAMYHSAAGVPFNIYQAGAVTPYVPAMPNQGSFASEMVSIIKFSPTGQHNWTTFQYADGAWNEDGDVSPPYSSVSRRYMLSTIDNGFVMTSSTYTKFPGTDITNVDGLVHSKTIFKPEKGAAKVVPTIRSFTKIEMPSGRNETNAFNIHVSKFDANGALAWALPVFPGDMFAGTGSSTVYRSTSFHIALMPSTEDILGLNAYKGTKVIDVNARFAEQSSQNGQFLKIASNGTFVRVPGAYYGTANAIGAPQDNMAAVKIGSDTYCFPLQGGKLSETFPLPASDPMMSAYIPPGIVGNWLDVNLTNLNITISGPALYPAQPADAIPETARSLKLLQNLTTPQTQTQIMVANRDLALTASSIAAYSKALDASASWIWNYPDAHINSWTPVNVDVDLVMDFNFPGTEPALGALLFMIDDRIKRIELNGKTLLSSPAGINIGFSSPARFAPGNFWLLPGSNTVKLVALNTGASAACIAMVVNASSGEVLAKTDNATTRTTQFVYAPPPMQFVPASYTSIGTSWATFISSTYTSSGAQFVSSYPFLSIPTARNWFRYWDSLYDFDLTNLSMSHQLPTTLSITAEGMYVRRIDILGMLGSGSKNIRDGSTAQPGGSGMFEINIPYGTSRVRIQSRNGDNSTNHGIIFLIKRKADNAIIFTSNPNNTFADISCPTHNIRLASGPTARGANISVTSSARLYAFGNRLLGNGTGDTSASPVDITASTPWSRYIGPLSVSLVTAGLGANHAVFSHGLTHSMYGDNTYGQLGIEEVYPALPMVANELMVSGLAYGNGTYTVQATSSDAYDATTINLPYGCFNFNEVASWTSAANKYDALGNYIGSATLVPGYSGEWIRLDLPGRIRVTRYDIFARADKPENAPRSLRLYGKRDGGPWELIDDETNLKYSSNVVTCTVTIQDSFIPGFNSYALVVNGTAGGKQVMMSAKFYGSRLGPFLVPDTIQDITDFQTSAALQQQFPPGLLTGPVTTFSPTEVQYGHGTYATSTSSMNNSTAFPFFYPPLGMTSNTTDMSSADYGQGIYKASASSEANSTNEAAWGAFNRDWIDANTHMWTSAVRYNASGVLTGTGIPTTTISGISYQGEWIQIELPTPIVAKEIHMYPRSNATIMVRNPKTFVISGSNNGTSFTQLFSISGYTSWTIGVASRFTLETPLAYRYYRVSIAATVGGSGYDGRAQMGEIALVTTDGDLTPQGLVRQPYAAFDGSVKTCWTSGDTYQCNGTYNGTTNLTGNYGGEWIQVQMPAAMRLTRLDVIGVSGVYAGAAGIFKIYGSNNGTSWTEVYNQSTRLVITPATPRASCILGSSALYSRFAIVVNRLAGNTSRVHTKFTLYGTRTRCAASLTKDLCSKANSAIPCGRDFTIFVRKEFGRGIDAYAFGRNDHGQLGVGHTNHCLTPQNISGMGSLGGRLICTIAAGEKHVIAVDTYGETHSWGSNSHGQLGNNLASSIVTTPSCISVLYGSLVGKRVFCAFAGTNSSFVLGFDGVVHAWGDNDMGCLGVQPFTSGAVQAIPVSLAGAGSLSGSSIYKGAAGDGFAVVLDISGRVHTWGRNDFGQCGRGADFNIMTTPGVVQGAIFNRIIHHVNASSHAAYVMDHLSDGFSWGRGDNGELGTGQNASSARPVAFGRFSYGTVTRVPTLSYPLDKLTASGSAAVCGAYALVRLSANYNGPTVRLRRSVDSQITDFYADISGNLTSGSAGSGIALSQWTGSGVAYVNVWYDQSGKGRDASQNTVTLQPTLPQMGGLVDFTTDGTFLTLPDGTVPTGNSSYTVTARHGYIWNSKGAFLASGNGSNHASNTFRRDNDRYVNYWWVNDIGTLSNTCFDGNTVTFSYDNATRDTTTSINGIKNNNNVRTTSRNSAASNNFIGKSTAAGENFRGELVNLFIFNIPLTVNDQAMVEGST